MTQAGSDTSVRRCAPTQYKYGRCATYSTSTGYPENVKTFDDLFEELELKAQTRPTGSRTVTEIDAGVHTIGKKIVEEAAEVWMAAEYQSDDETAAEISQLLYHLQVLMLAKGLTTADVYRHL